MRKKNAIRLTLLSVLSVPLILCPPLFFHRDLASLTSTKTNNFSSSSVPINNRSTSINFPEKIFSKREAADLVYADNYFTSMQTDPKSIVTLTAMRTASSNPVHADYVSASLKQNKFYVKDDVVISDTSPLPPYQILVEKYNINPENVSETTPVNDLLTLDGDNSVNINLDKKTGKWNKKYDQTLKEDGTEAFKITWVFGNQNLSTASDDHDMINWTNALGNRDLDDIKINYKKIDTTGNDYTLNILSILMVKAFGRPNSFYPIYADNNNKYVSTTHITTTNWVDDYNKEWISSKDLSSSNFDLLKTPEETLELFNSQDFLKNFKDFLFVSGYNFPYFLEKFMTVKATAINSTGELRFVVRPNFFINLNDFLPEFDSKGNFVKNNPGFFVKTLGEFRFSVKGFKKGKTDAAITFNNSLYPEILKKYTVEEYENYTNHEKNSSLDVNEFVVKDIVNVKINNPVQGAEYKIKVDSSKSKYAEGKIFFVITTNVIYNSQTNNFDKLNYFVDIPTTNSKDGLTGLLPTTPNGIKNYFKTNPIVDLRNVTGIKTLKNINILKQDIRLQIVDILKNKQSEVLASNVNPKYFYPKGFDFANDLLFNFSLTDLDLKVPDEKNPNIFHSEILANLNVKNEFGIDGKISPNLEAIKIKIKLPYANIPDFGSVAPISTSIKISELSLSDIREFLYNTPWYKAQKTLLPESNFKDYVSITTWNNLSEPNDVTGKMTINFPQIFKCFNSEGKYVSVWEDNNKKNNLEIQSSSTQLPTTITINTDNSFYIDFVSPTKYYFEFKSELEKRFLNNDPSIQDLFKIQNSYSTKTKIVSLDFDNSYFDYVENSFTISANVSYFYNQNGILSGVSEEGELFQTDFVFKGFNISSTSVKPGTFSWKNSNEYIQQIIANGSIKKYIDENLSLILNNYLKLDQYSTQINEIQIDADKTNYINGQFTVDFSLSNYIVNGDIVKGIQSKPGEKLPFTIKFDNAKKNQVTKIQNNDLIFNLPNDMFVSNVDESMVINYVRSKLSDSMIPWKYLKTDPEPLSDLISVSFKDGTLDNSNGTMQADIFINEAFATDGSISTYAFILNIKASKFQEKTSKMEKPVLTSQTFNRQIIADILPTKNQNWNGSSIKMFLFDNLSKIFSNIPSFSLSDFDIDELSVVTHSMGYKQPNKETSSGYIQLRVVLYKFYDERGNIADYDSNGEKPKLYSDLITIYGFKETFPTNDQTFNKILNPKYSTSHQFGSAIIRISHTDSLDQNTALKEYLISKSKLDGSAYWPGDNPISNIVGLKEVDNRGGDFIKEYTGKRYWKMTLNKYYDPEGSGSIISEKNKELNLFIDVAFTNLDFSGNEQNSQHSSLTTWIFGFAMIFGIFIVGLVVLVIVYKFILAKR